MRYSPGFKYQYNNRFCQLLKGEFRYFKNELMSFKHIFPLFSVSIHDIEKVQRVSVNVPVVTLMEEDLNLHQFEIILKKKGVDNDTPLIIPHNFIEERKESVNISTLNESELQCSRMNRFKQSTNKHLDIYGGNAFRRSLESPERKVKTILNRSCSESRYCSPHHMMPKPSLARSNRSTSPQCRALLYHP